MGFVGERDIMILHFPCLTRHDPEDIRAGRIDKKWYQRRLSEYNQGVSFADMVDYRLDQYTRAVLAENADHAVDLTYPCIRDQVEA